MFSERIETCAAHSKTSAKTTSVFQEMVRQSMPSMQQDINTVQRSIVRMQEKKKILKKTTTFFFFISQENTTVLPMHSAIAILRLIKGEMSEEYYGIQITDLIFSALFTTSVLTHAEECQMDEEWFMWNVDALMNSIESIGLSSETALKTLHSFQYSDGKVLF